MGFMAYAICEKNILLIFFQQHICLIIACSFWGLGSVTQVLLSFLCFHILFKILLKSIIFSPAHCTPPASVLLTTYNFICQARILFVSYNWREIFVLILVKFFIDFSEWHCLSLSSLQTSKISVLQSRDQLHCNHRTES